MKVTTVRLPQKLDEQLSEYAKEYDLSKNQVVKMELKKLFETQEKGA